MKDLGKMRRADWLGWSGWAGWWLGAVVLGMVLPVYGQYGGGDGSATNPYQIWDPNQMNAIGTYSRDWDKHFKLMADIDMSRFTGTQYNVIGYSGVQFTGTFNGNGHIIRNLTYTTTNPINYRGLFGYTRNATIKNLGVENVSISTGGNNVGGLAGSNVAGTITNCYVTGMVNGASYVGGLVGQTKGLITACYATSSVSGTGSYVGGLVGGNLWSNIINSCYATGSVSGNDYVGRLVGSNIYSTIASSFWELQSSGQISSSGGKGLTTEQMKTMSIYQNAGWADKGWVMEDGLDYPRLSWENTEGVPIPSPQPIPLSGNGTIADPYLISTAEEFALLSWYSGILNKHIRLTANLDLSGILLYPFGDLGPFTGVFDGDGHTISNAIINHLGSDSVALFEYLNSEGQIFDLHLENVQMTGRNFIGGLVGMNYGTITDCYVTGLVNGYFAVGGLVGYNNYNIQPHFDSIITGSYVNGSISGTYAVGGLVGYNTSGTINECYATGWVRGFGDCVGGLVGDNVSGALNECYATGSVRGFGDYVGGLVGDNSGALNQCYATCSVNGSGDFIGGLVGDSYSDHITASFWDTQTSGQTKSAGGTGKTTIQMMTLATFVGAGWDFTEGDGDAAEWMMLREGEDYPRLAWQEVYGGDIAGLYGVDMEDLLEVAGNWLEEGCPAGCEEADINGDGAVDLEDLAVVVGEWLKS